MTHYREVQYIRRPWLIALLLLIPAFSAYHLWSNYQDGERIGATYDIGIGINVLGTLAFVLWFAFMRLETEVRDDAVRLRYRLLWFPKTIPFSEIARAEQFTYSPFRDYGGWGIRRGKAGWLWNARGNQAVALHLADGSQFSIGTQRPDQLEQALRARLGAPAPPAVQPQ